MVLKECASAKPGVRVCYLSVDGMTDPLGQSQVLPYLTALAARGHNITLLSLEKPSRMAETGDAVAGKCAEAGIDWQPLPYLQKPPILAGLLNVVRMGRRAWKLHGQAPFDLVHARSDLASLAGRRLWRAGGAKFLYDMRALWPDERVEGGSWPQDRWIYRRIFQLFKKYQARFLNEADFIVTLTRRGREIIEAWPGRAGKGNVAVIPCCADFEHFKILTNEQRAAARFRLKINERAYVVVYAGSVGTWYMLREMFALVAACRAHHPQAIFLIITPDDAAAIREQGREAGIEEGLIIRRASREEMPTLLGLADAGVSFIAPVFSKQASSPTKMAEMLACGLPVVCNDGVGDVGDIVRDTGSGVLTERFDRDALTEAVGRLNALDHDPPRARERARAWFDLGRGVAAYDEIYRTLSKQDFAA